MMSIRTFFYTIFIFIFAVNGNKTRFFVHYSIVESRANSFVLLICEYLCDKRDSIKQKKIFFPTNKPITRFFFFFFFFFFLFEIDEDDEKKKNKNQICKFRSFMSFSSIIKFSDIARSVQ